MNVYEIIGSILAAFVVGLFYRLYPKVKAWFEATARRTRRRSGSLSALSQERRNSFFTIRTPPAHSVTNLSGNSLPTWVLRSQRLYLI